MHKLCFVNGNVHKCNASHGHFSNECQMQHKSVLMLGPIQNCPVPTTSTVLALVSTKPSFLAQ